jgi:gamma-glutamyltranspeptidase/glutathione hydrolase
MRRSLLPKLALLFALIPSAGLGAEATRHMIAASHPLAAQAGLTVLRQGGSALDAAIAAQAVLTLVEPQSSGIGGGALLLHWGAAERRLTAWDGRETAPEAATPSLFLRQGRPMAFGEASTGGRAVGVPGVLRMLEAAHRAHGRLPWSALFQPAIAMAEEGVVVTPRLAAMLGPQAARLRLDAGAAALFLTEDGRPVQAGQLLRNPALATTLRAVAEQGAGALHAGPIATAIVAAVRGHATNPGVMTEADLAAYAPIRRAPLCATYRAVLVCGFPPPSSGGVAVLQTLGVLRHQDMPGLDPRGTDHAHLLVEAGRLAFADRNRFLADADHVPVPVSGLLDPVYLALRAQLVDRDRALPALRAGNPAWSGARTPRRGPTDWASQPAQPEGGTAHLSVVDSNGDVVAMTTTIETAFGAAMLVGGFLLNNQLTDFAFLPEREGRPVANRVGPGKRPRSSMAPTIVFDAAGKPVLAIGSAGGERIIGHIAQALIVILDHGLSPQAAFELPHVAGLHEHAELEAAGPAMAALATQLEARGFPVHVRANVSGLHAVQVLRGPEGRRLRGGADPRREGVAIGD